MSTTTEATEGQAKIQDALRDGMYYAQRAMDHDSSLGKMKSADEAEAAFDRMAAARIIAQGIAQAPQSSPAPGAQPDGIMNEGYLEATRAHGSPAPSVIEAIELMEAYEQAGGDGWWKAWDKVKAAAKASRPSVTAPQGVTEDQILEVVNDWRANMHLIEVPPNTPYSTGVQNVLRSRLSALLTK